MLPRSTPLLKWAGGKTEELPVIASCMPGGIGKLVEPFVGGGAVWLSAQARTYSVNDRSTDLVDLYRSIRDAEPALRDVLAEFAALWQAADDAAAQQFCLVSLARRCAVEGAGAIDHAAAVRFLSHCRRIGLGASLETALVTTLADKGRQMSRLAGRGAVLTEKDAASIAETALKAAVYTAARECYNRASRIPDGAGNRARRAGLFWIMRQYCYGGMFRTNAAGDFNVPYGGISYNSKNPEALIARLSDPALTARLRNTRIQNGDFEEFLDAEAPEPDDLVFLDPPYDGPFSTYDGNAFGREDHLRLASWLRGRCRSRWLMVIGRTDFIAETYDLPGTHVAGFDRDYRVSFMSRNDRRARHLVIANYPLERPGAAARAA